MITAVCMNPSFDRTVEVDVLVPGEVNRIRSVREDVGGKGINVAATARRLGVDVQCIGCAGEESLQKLQSAMKRLGIPHAFVPVNGEVRTNMKVFSRDGSGVTELNEPGTEISREQLDQFIALAQKEAVQSEIMIFTGSLPPGCPQGIYCDLINAMGDVPCVLDAVGEELLLGLSAHPLLVKPNLHELETTLGVELRTMRAIRDAAFKLLDMGARNVVVSMGSMGALFAGDGKAYFAPAVKVEVKSTVGAGDAMVAGLMKGYLEHRQMLKAFRYGVAAGAATVQMEGTQPIEAEEFFRLLEQVRVQEV